MFDRIRRISASCLLASCLGAVTVASPAGAASTVEVTFAVENMNRSRVPCASDGAAYEVKGTLVSPQEIPASVTLYVHGSSAGRWEWRLPVPGYDFALEMAELGHASVVIDRLGYDESGHPDGFQTCIGSEADIVHQIVERLRTGSYGASGAAPVAFEKVAIGGHSSGAVVAEAAAYSFGEIDGLIIIGSPVVVDPRPIFPDATLYAAMTCAQGGESPAEAPTVSGYVRKWQSFDDEARALFYDVEESVLEVLPPLINHDPCEEEATVIPALFVRDAFAWNVRTPVIGVFGDHDAFAPPPNGQLVGAVYAGASDFTVLTIPATGHTPLLERQAPFFRAQLHGWLAARGL